MAEKTNLTSNEVVDLLMDIPLEVFEWVQQAKLHVKLDDGFESIFTRDDLRHFAISRGLSLGRPDKNKLRVLIVDNDSRFTRFLVELFDTLSETIVASAVENAADAESSLLRNRFDIVLVELILTNHESLALCRRIKSDHSTRHVRLITMSHHQNEELVQRSFMLGAEACLAKPVEHQKLFDAMGLQMHIPEKGEVLRPEIYQQH
ncbi:MAG: response regulator [Ectothiorhodospiraceae bacterium]|nr:response regulator [Ectothiorhodospiraceae bacterium]